MCKLVFRCMYVTYFGLGQICFISKLFLFVFVSFFVFCFVFLFFVVVFVCLFVFVVLFCLFCCFVLFVCLFCCCFLLLFFVFLYFVRSNCMYLGLGHLVLSYTIRGMHL